MSGKTCPLRKKVVYDETATTPAAIVPPKDITPTSRDIKGAPAGATDTVTVTAKTPPPSSSSSDSKNTDFQNELPSSVINEIEIIRRQTEKDNKEKAITFCELDNRLFVGNYTRGDAGSTTVATCHKKFGKNAKKIGDAHTHPFNASGTIGATPSEADFVSNLGDSFQLGIPQVSCVVGSGKINPLKRSSHVHCFQPKEEVMNDPTKLKLYNRALMNSSNVGNDVSPYFRENIDSDFDHIWYDKKGKAIPVERESDYETSKELFEEMLGASKKRLRMSDIKDMDKGSFCQLIQAYNMPTNNNISNICYSELKKREILGHQY